MNTLRTLLLLSAALLAAPAQALNILVSNDDGFETANVRALVTQLRAAGHDVVLSAPTQNNSGKGGSMNFLTPITPLARDSRYGSVKAGAPGVGADPVDPDAYYVDGTPVMAVLHGLDVLAPARWQAQPDLVISGPNEGGNTGLINNSSGTVNNVLYAINRGIPAIAASYQGTGSRSHTALTAGAPEYELADVLVKLVARLEQNRPGSQPLLPPGTGLNVNIPKFATGTAATLPYRQSQMGRATEYQPVFFSKLSDSPIARGFGAGVPLPGISFANAQVPPPAGVVIASDEDPQSEANVVHAGAIAVTVFGGLPLASESDAAQVKNRLRGLVSAGSAP